MKQRKKKEMNKIHNNLTIENLIKTEWFNQFDENQKKEILEGLEDNLDVSIYAKPTFNWKQMSEIRFGLSFNLDSSIYAKSDFDDEQMNQIILGLLNGLDVSIYAKPRITADMMFKIREELLTKKRYG